MKKLGIAALLLLPVALAACSTGGGGPKKPKYPATITVTGDISVSGATNVTGSISQCAGVGQYADLVVGAPATVTNQVGKPVGIGKIAYSVGTNVYENRLDQCTFRYLVIAVPRQRSYFITVADQPPQPVTFLAVFATSGVYDFNLPVRPPPKFPTNPLVSTTVPKRPR